MRYNLVNGQAQAGTQQSVDQSNCASSTVNYNQQAGTFSCGGVTTQPCALPQCKTYQCQCQLTGSCGQQTCGATGFQSQNCACVEVTNGLSSGVQVSPTLCPGVCQSSQTPCATLPCCSTYSCQLNGAFSQCSNTCGNGVMTRAASCVRSCAGQAAVTVDVSECSANQVTCQSTNQPCQICPSQPSAPNQVPVYITAAPIQYVAPPQIQYVPQTQVQYVPVLATSAPQVQYVQQQVQYQYVPVSAPPVQQNIQYQYVPVAQQQVVQQNIQYVSATAVPQQVFVQQTQQSQYYRNAQNQCVSITSPSIVIDNVFCTQRRRGAAAQPDPLAQGQSPLVIALGASGALTILASAIVVFRRLADKRVAEALLQLGVSE